MKKLALLVLFVFALYSCHRKSATENEQAADTSKQTLADTAKTILDRYPLLTWMRKNPAEIGCILETELGYRDSLFNCDYKNYTNKGDPCNDENHYYEGVDFPDSLAFRINPALLQFAMDFEHGELQQLALTFKDSLPIGTVKAMFHLPLQKGVLPDNVMEIDCGENYSTKTKLVVIIGFEHMGAGDVDCN